jgi:hypothetical protein
MDCRFCNVRPAKYRTMPTVFGPADLCQVCADRYRRYLRRRRRRPRNETSGPAMAARLDVLLPPSPASPEENPCHSQV